MDKLTLYKITDEYRCLMAALEADEGELTPEMEQALEINDQQMVEKAGGYARLILYYTQYAAAAKAEKLRVAALQQKAEKAVERLKARLAEAMTVFEKDKIETDNLKLSLRRSESVVIDDIESLPAECIVITKAADKTAVKDFIKAHGACPGAHVESKKNLQIR